MSLSGHGLRPESEDATRKERGERMLSFIVRFRSALAEGSEAAARVLSSDGAVAFFSSAELARLQGQVTARRRAEEQRQLEERRRPMLQRFERALQAGSREAEGVLADLASESLFGSSELVVLQGRIEQQRRDELEKRRQSALRRFEKALQAGSTEAEGVRADIGSGSLFDASELKAFSRRIEQRRSQELKERRQSTLQRFEKALQAGSAVAEQFLADHGIGSLFDASEQKTLHHRIEQRRLEEHRQVMLQRLERALQAGSRDAEGVLADIGSSNLFEASALRGLRRRIEQRKKIECKERLAAVLQDALATNYLAAESTLKSHPQGHFLDRADIRQLTAAFVQRWASRELSRDLDLDQAAAVGAHGGDIQVVARAGSGKTRTLVTRAIFLVKHCGVPPRSLLLLAFNKSAAEEMKKRLKGALGDDLPHVMTFHALAHALVQPGGKILHDDESAGNLGLSRAIQDAIDDHIRAPETGTRIRELMLAHFRTDWERIEDGKFHLPMAEFLEYRRSLARETLGGEHVKSYGEKLIANVLLENAVDYKYEANHRHNGVNYRPDFTIRTGDSSGVVIEYLGMAGDPDYDEMSEEKRAYWAGQQGWELLAIEPWMIAGVGAERFAEQLVRRLEGLGVKPRRRSEEEIWQLVRERALDSFTSAMRTFVGRCRVINLSDERLANLLFSHVALSDVEERFLSIARGIYRRYLTLVGNPEQLDFPGVVWSAISLIRQGCTRFHRDRGREQGDLKDLRYVMVDEFQDFSEMFYQLIAAVRSQNPQAELFCVGDDWQAINAFAGSHLRYTREFGRRFRDTERLVIPTNYRSAREIVALGNALMGARGEPATASLAQPGQILLCPLDRFRPTQIESTRYDGSEIVSAVFRLVRHYLDECENVAVLSRRNSIRGYYARTGSSTSALGSFKALLQHHLPAADRRRVDVSTTHKFKGREADAVIVIDAFDQSYPLIHPNWVFTRVFGDDLEEVVEEERRLFYVAITRARRHLALVTESGRETPFLAEMGSRVTLQVLEWDDLAPAPSSTAPRIEIRVRHAFDVRDILKAHGFNFHDHDKSWRRSVPQQGFQWERLVSQPWAKHPGLTLEAYSDAGELLHSKSI